MLLPPEHTNPHYPPPRLINFIATHKPIKSRLPAVSAAGKYKFKGMIIA
jgi:hypothetical protein